MPLLQVKSLARSENTIAKKHSSTTALSPMFVLYSSNERLFKHRIPAPIRGTGFGQTLHSQIETCKKNPSPENVEAVRARFLEMFVFKAPQQDPHDLNVCTTFSRETFLLGSYLRALKLLEQYEPSQFHSAHLPAYIIAALVRHADFFKAVMGEDQSSQDPEGHPPQFQERLERLQEKYNVALSE